MTLLNFVKIILDKVKIEIKLYSHLKIRQIYVRLNAIFYEIYPQY